MSNDVNCEALVSISRTSFSQQIISTFFKMWYGMVRRDDPKYDLILPGTVKKTPLEKHIGTVRLGRHKTFSPFRQIKPTCRCQKLHQDED